AQLLEQPFGLRSARPDRRRIDRRERGRHAAANGFHFHAVQVTHLLLLLLVPPLRRLCYGTLPALGWRPRQAPTRPLTEYKGSHIHSISRRRSPMMSASTSIPGFNASSLPYAVTAWRASVTVMR